MRVRRHFREQADACAGLGSPFTATLLSLVAERLDGASAVGRAVLSWPGDPRADALALRLAGGLHALVLTGAAPALAAVYPGGARAGDPAELWRAVTQALEAHARYVAAFLQHPPQTNEVARSAVLLGGFLTIAAETGLPLRLLEIGASAGLNLLWDAYACDLAGATWGSQDAALRLSPTWQGALPPLVPVEIRERRGCDRTPIDPHGAEGRLRLRAYVWADQPARGRRLETAHDGVARAGLRVEPADAADWVERQLAAPAPGAATVLFHSIVWQYLPQRTRHRIAAAIERAGRVRFAARLAAHGARPRRRPCRAPPDAVARGRSAPARPRRLPRPLASLAERRRRVAAGGETHRRSWGRVGVLAGKAIRRGVLVLPRRSTRTIGRDVPLVDLVTLTSDGVYCPSGGFHIDPWRPVERALITHAHGDHARRGSHRYHAARSGVGLLRHRLGPEATIVGHGFGEPLAFGDATVSFHPAGHVLGSAQIRIEAGGAVWVVSGDYKRDLDPSCEAFEVVRCEVFITEATFALPVYRWDPIDEVMTALLGWWDANAIAGRASVLFCYALGKAQRVLAEIGRRTERRVLVHGAVDAFLEAYRCEGVALAPTLPVGARIKGESFAGELIIAPPSAFGSPWMRRFGDAGTGFASGWMRVRGNRRRRGFDRGFVLSDHVDWPGLLQTIEATGARRVLATHGYADTLARYLSGIGLAAEPLDTRFEGEVEDGD